MLKYRNISGATLHIDCISCTVHMEPQQIMFLPKCRDSRFYMKIGKLALVRKEQVIVKSDPPKRRGKKRTRKWKKSKEEKNKHEKVENK